MKDIMIYNALKDIDECSLILYDLDIIFARYLSNYISSKQYIDLKRISYKLEKEAFEIYGSLIEKTDISENVIQINEIKKELIRVNNEVYLMKDKKLYLDKEFNIDENIICFIKIEEVLKYNTLSLIMKRIRGILVSIKLDMQTIII